MKNSVRAVASGLAVVVAAGCASSRHIVPPKVTSELSVPAGHKPVLKTHAKGTQIYVCSPKKDAPDTFEWQLKGPDAVLTNHEGMVGKHYEGPTWEHRDGSRVIAAMAAKADAPDKDAIPWLLLKAKSNEGLGVMTRVSYIQRVDTKGGKAPASGCDAQRPGAETRAEYEASYYFYAPVE
jgi:hypothetical protein